MTKSKTYDATLEFPALRHVMEYYVTMPMFQQAFEAEDDRSKLLRDVFRRDFIT